MMPIGAARAGVVSGGELAIPDSEANQKLVHRWVLSEDSGPFEDSAGDADATNNGTTQVTDGWAGGAAREGNGTDQYIEATSLGDFGSNMNSDFAIAFSIQAAEGNADDLMGMRDGTQEFLVQFGTRGSGGTNGRLSTFYRDEDGDRLVVEADQDADDDTQRRVVINKQGNSASDIDIWFDQSEISTSIINDEAFDSVSDFTRSLLLFGGNSDGSKDPSYEGILDDVCFFGDSLTDSEIESYGNPWT